MTLLRRYRDAVVLGGGVLGLVTLALVVYCLFDIATSRSSDVRLLPKPVWFPVVLLLPLAGSVLWLALGRPEAGSGRAVPSVLPERGRAPSTPDDDEAFLRQLRERAEEQRRRGQQAQSPDPEDEDGPTAH